MNEPTHFEIADPLVVMFREPEGNVLCHLHPPEDWTHEHYGLLVCDLVRHVANAFKVDEDAVWDWVDQERHLPTDKPRRIA